MTFTFDIIATNQPHQLAAVLAYGRETLVPQLFSSLIDGLKIKTSEVPGLFGYLELHIQLDEQEHGPVAALMVQELCGESKDKQLNKDIIILASEFVKKLTHLLTADSSDNK